MVNYVHRARDIRYTLQNYGMDDGVRRCLEHLAEDNEMLRQEMTEVIRAMNKMADIVANIATVGERLRHDWAAVRQAMHPNNEAAHDIEDTH
jgi:hypothetical protein